MTGASSATCHAVARSAKEEAFRVCVEFNMCTIQHGTRVREKEEIELICKSKEDLTDVVAALRQLSGK